MKLRKITIWFLIVAILMMFTQGIVLCDELAASEASYQTQADGEWVIGSFSKALSDVYDGGTIKLLKDIELTDTVMIEKKVTITSEDVSSLKKITSSTQQHGYLFCILDDMTMENVIIDGGSENNVEASGPMISVGNPIKSGKLTLGEGAVLCNNNNTAERGAGGAVSVIFGELVLSGGQISKNSAFAGSAIAAVTENANVIINDGSMIFENNTTDSGFSGGGAIFIADGIVTMTGGEIKNNSAAGCGGAVFVSKEDDDSIASFKLQGGSITGNTANYGAGMYLSTSKLVELSGGTVSDNEAAKEGGGIYAAPDNSISVSGDIVIDENAAEVSGSNLYLLYNPSFTVGQLNSTAKINILTFNKPEANNELVVALPIAEHTITNDDLSKLSFEDASYGFKISNGSIVLEMVYTISFDANGGICNTSSSKTVNSKLESLPNPTRSGYSFNGWYDAQEGGQSITTETVFSQDTTVYAQWSQISSGGMGGSSVQTTYTIRFETDGGSEIKSERVAKNKILAQPPIPEKDGYSFIGWYTDEELTNAYNFDAKVTNNFTLFAKWEKSDVEEPVKFENPFIDVKADDWYYESVMFAAENGLLNGVTDTEFAPNTNITRAMLVTVLWRMENKPSTDYLMTFEDIEEKSYYAEALRWAASEQIVKGYSDIEFAPDKDIIREEIAAVMYRYAKFKGMDVSAKEDISAYEDADSISEYAVPAIEYAVASGLLKGKSETTLNPKDNVTRAEFAAILQRFAEIK